MVGLVLAERLARPLDRLLAEGLELAHEFLPRLVIFHLGEEACALREHLGGQIGVPLCVGGEETKGHVPLVAHVAGGVTRHDREVVVGELKRGAAEEGRLRGERLEFGETRARGGEAFGVRGDLRRDGRRCGGLLAEADSGEGRGGENGCEACFFHKMDSLSNDWLYYKAK